MWKRESETGNPSVSYGTIIDNPIIIDKNGFRKAKINYTTKIYL